jgi:D-arabinose 1-dehydrogenase-like Zn-dependent alcohol dehydrogenase
MALLNGGGYAEYAHRRRGGGDGDPGRLSMVEAAAIPETFMTVWHNVFERGGLVKGDWFLVHGGTSGIGVTAIPACLGVWCARDRDRGIDERNAKRVSRWGQIVRSTTRQRISSRP